MNKCNYIQSITIISMQNTEDDLKIFLYMYCIAVYSQYYLPVSATDQKALMKSTEAYWTVSTILRDLSSASTTYLPPKNIK